MKNLGLHFFRQMTRCSSINKYPQFWEFVIKTIQHHLEQNTMNCNNPNSDAAREIDLSICYAAGKV